MSGFPAPDARHPDTPPRRVVSWPLRVLATLAGLLGLFLVVGLALPGTWTVERSATLEAAPERVFAFVDAPAAWRAWTAWPDVALESEGPERGEGARVRWDDETWGDGVFTITGSAAPREVAYEVRVQEGSMVTRGRIRLEPADGGTRVTWSESGDFGWNPLMGYAALGMDRMQGAELEKGLARLDSVSAAAGPSLPAGGPNAGRASPP